jgi:antitoxin YefM
MTATAARSDLFNLIEQVNQDRVPVHITSRRGNVVMMAQDDWDAWQETAYLFASPANARRLLGAMGRIAEGKREHHDLDLDQD